MKSLLLFKYLYELEDIPVPSEVQHVVHSVPSEITADSLAPKSQQSSLLHKQPKKSAKYKNWSEQLQERKSGGNPKIREMAWQTRYDAEKNNTIRMKVTPYTTQEFFCVDPSSQRSGVFLSRRGRSFR